MSDAEIIRSTELILKVSLARTPLVISGVIQDNTLNELSGCVSIEKSLSALLVDLGANYEAAANVLTQLLDNTVSDIMLDKLAAAYRSNANVKFIQAGCLMTVGDNRCQFALLKNLKQDGFIAGLDFQSRKTIPKKYNFLSGLIGDIAISNFGIYYANEAFDKVAFCPADAFHDASRILPSIVAVKEKKFPKGLSFSADILIGGVNIFDLLQQGMTDALTSALPRDTPPASEAAIHEEQGKASETADVNNALATGLTKWFTVDKTIGPVIIRRVGLSYESPRAGIKFDAGFSLSVLTLSLYGMGISYPLNKVSKDPKVVWGNIKFHLDGAGVTFAEGPLVISGNLLKVKDDPLQLDGSLLIKTEPFAISALGSYTTINGSPSFFVYAAFQQPLGGPAFFFVTGLAFGLGINRTLKLPTINEVHNFPLIRAVTDENYLKNADMRSISQNLQEYIAPSEGDIWIAAGVKFTSFGQIDSFALLSVSFGTQFEIALLGLSKLYVPKLPAKALAYAELAMKAVFAPDSGLLSIEARLTENSYVLRKDFVLRGGFAFYSWFAGTQEGDFVISIGGYHPRFLPPAHYPKPDLVEFRCKIGYTTIQGHCYFALCPSAIMAGGGLCIVYQTGGIKAWFIAYADFLIQWKPLYYDVAIGVSIGVALNLKVAFVRVKLSVELSASVNLYGPPLGGKARISLYIISFTVKFGQNRSVPPPLSWESKDEEKSFASAFLPNPTVTRLTVVDGLLEEVETKEQKLWIVNPHQLSLSCRTLVPATAAQFNDWSFAYDSEVESRKIPRPEINGQPVDLAVRPLGKASVYSILKVTLEPSVGASADARKYLAQYIDIKLTTKSVPVALWGKPDADKNRPPKANEQMINNALLGFEIRTKPGPRPWETQALDLNVLAYDRFSKSFQWTVVTTPEPLAAYGNRTISNTIEQLEEREIRKRIHDGTEWVLPVEDGPEREKAIAERVAAVQAWSAQVAQTRLAIMQCLVKTGRRIMNPQDIHLNQVSEKAPYLFQSMPAMACVGQYPPAKYQEV